jgi:hypothetical protein
MEPGGYQLYEFVPLVNLGFGKLTVFWAGVGSGNDGGFHKRFKLVLLASLRTIWLFLLGATVPESADIEVHLVRTAHTPLLTCCYC